jgi:hypothetical protein
VNTIYKVVRVTDNSTYVSALESPLVHAYCIGKKTRSRVPNALLFGFDSFYTAERFADIVSRLNGNMAIFSAEASVSQRRIGLIPAGCSSVESIAMFWSDLSSGVIFPPPGTVCCEWIKLVKKIKDIWPVRI